MVLLTDISFFNEELNIPNTDKANVAANVIWFIQKYETELLKQLLGYDLYTALQAELQLNAGLFSERMKNLVFGVDYVDGYGKNKEWRGLIETNAPVYNFPISAISYKRPVRLQVGVTLNSLNAVIIPSNSTSFMVVDWIGWNPIIERIGAGTMRLDIDYSYDIETGTVTLLQIGDKFNANEFFFVQFELIQREIPEPVEEYGVIKLSLIANYVYWYWTKNQATQSSGIGEVKTKVGNADNASPAQKMVSAWNDMVAWIWELNNFLKANQTIYPERLYIDYCTFSRFEKINIFGI